MLGSCAIFVFSPNAQASPAEMAALRWRLATLSQQDRLFVE